jgi:hypothetical protein
VSVQIDTEPSPMSVVTSVEGGFMFAVALVGFSLTDPSITYFDISLYQNYYSPLFQTINTTKVPLVACTPDHFAFNSDILALYYKFSLKDALCPPIGH